MAAELAVWHRTYVRATPRPAALAATAAGAGAGWVSAEDRERIEAAVERARQRRGDLAADLFDWLGRVLLLRVRGEAAAELAMRFQQVSAPAMAKGVEDTALYRFGRAAGAQRGRRRSGPFLASRRRSSRRAAARRRNAGRRPC